MYSEILGHTICMPMTTTAIRTIDKHGGLDKYLLNTKPKKIDSEAGMALRQRIKEALQLREPEKALTTKRQPKLAPQSVEDTSKVPKIL